MKKMLCASLVILIILSGTLLGVNRRNDSKILQKSDNKIELLERDLLHKVSLKKSSLGNTTSILDTISLYYTPESEGSYGDFLAGYQTAGDTVFQRFKLLAPGRVNKFMMQNNSAGEATCFLWNPAVQWHEDGSGTYLFPKDKEIQQMFPFGLPLNCQVTDPAEQFTNYEWTPTWNSLDIVGSIGQGIELKKDSLYFLIGYVLDANGAPGIFQDGKYHDKNIEGNPGSFSTLNQVGSGYYSITHQDNSDLYLNHMMQVVVEYDAMPPVISDVTKACDTYSETKRVQAKIIDIDSDTYSAEIRFKIGKNGEYSNISMTNSSGDLYSGEITAEIGDTIYYYVRADDGDLANVSSVQNYTILDKPENTPLLLVNNNGRTDNDSLFSIAINNLNKKFEVWNMSDHKGIDKSVLDYEKFNTILLYGWGTDITPAFKEEDIYDFKGLLNSGKNLVIIDMDFLYKHDADAEGVFVEGDFAYDYLGIEAFKSDPGQGSGSNFVSETELSMVGVDGNALTSDFVSDSYGLIDYELISGWKNWADILNPKSGAATIFYGKEKGASMAVSYDGGNFKTVTFGFPIELTQDISELETLLSNIFDWFGTYTNIEENEDIIISEYKLSQNYPNPFNPSTRIDYQLPQTTNVTLTIYNVLGQKITTIVDSKQNYGRHSVIWNGRDISGSIVPAGVYLYKMETSNHSVMKKMLFVK